MTARPFQDIICNSGQLSTFGNYDVCVQHYMYTYIVTICDSGDKLMLNANFQAVNTQGHQEP